MTDREAPEGKVPRGGDPAIMAARYGEAPSAQARRRGFVAAAVVAGLLILGGVAVQAANLTQPVVTTENLGFTVNDATSTTVRFNVRTDPGTSVRCTLVALNDGFTEVGFRTLELGPVDERVSSHQVDVPTTELATTGSVDSCEIVDAG
ncbi:DUF4307 domain-containing protein [Georgenia subflava]|uniref:DUF4307 domain-containing protein n=1 Tax=Georgenia subflava TaxID=1622177 RepID=A0A6N7ELW5_9MICO|nr:DUF4307 domain-containing protein [Georgenia subflava]MPV38108.1 DUF4307 domain-containing protein [Georgenia subflava]